MDSARDWQMVRDESVFARAWCVRPYPLRYMNGPRPRSAGRTASVRGGASSAGRAYKVYRVTYARCVAGSRPGEVEERSKRKEESDRGRSRLGWDRRSRPVILPDKLLGPARSGRGAIGM